MGLTAGTLADGRNFHTLNIAHDVTFERVAVDRWLQVTCGLLDSLAARTAGTNEGFKSEDLALCTDRM